MVLGGAEFSRAVVRAITIGRMGQRFAVLTYAG